MPEIEVPKLWLALVAGLLERVVLPAMMRSEAGTDAGRRIA